jgi:NDP-sugar pyrophosphorylase family protein
MLRIDDLLDLEHTIAAELFEGKTHPWEVLDDISDFLLKLGETLSEEDFVHPMPDIWIARDARVAPSAFIQGPCIIDRGAEIRHCAYIRGSVLVGKNCVVGNSTEVKNAILFDMVQVPHYNYVGDSILGYKAHMGAGAVTSNVKSDRSLVTVKTQEETIHTGRKKFGAILGDHAEIGCNSVLNPGCVIGRCSNVYPLSSVRGVVGGNCIFKATGNVVDKQPK